jgi:hypothetical protein
VLRLKEIDSHVPGISLVISIKSINFARSPKKIDNPLSIMDKDIQGRETMYG